MSDLTISFDPDGPTATYLQSNTPTRTRGETVSLSIGFDPQSHANDYDDMVERLAFVSPVRTGRNHNGVPWVQEDLPARAPVSSQVLEVVPGAGVDDIESFWGALVGGTDESMPPRGLKTMTVELVFLADGDEYADRTALKNDIGPNSL